MKTKETLYTTMCNNIGQVRIENAQKEIERLNRQYNTNSWRTDNSPFMFVEDETDDDVHNPCELIEGYVWVTCEPKVKSTKELAADWFTSKSYLEQHSLSDKYFESRHPSLLTIEQVEEIWKNEVQVKEFSNAYHNAEYLIPKQNSTTQVVREAMRIVSKDVRPPKVVRDGLVKPNQKQYSQEEVDRLLDQQAARTTAQVLRSNQKQFKQFDESLHKAYLNKFSEEDKFKAFISNLNELSKEIQFNAFLATLKKMNLDSQTQSNIMTLVALKDI